MEVLALSDDEKIAILKGARDLLGPNGEHWVKCTWCALVDGRIESGRDYSNASLDFTENEQADKANAWCLMGAIEESAYRLGITNNRQASEERLANPVSLRNLVDSKEEWRDWEIVDINDAADTTFETIRGLLDERLAQLS